MNQEKFEVTKDYKTIYEIVRDGDSFCATSRNFKNIQESPCGFGDTPTQALEELLKDKQNIECGYNCGIQEPYGFVPEAGCPIHD